MKLQQLRETSSCLNDSLQACPLLFDKSSDGLYKPLLRMKLQNLQWFMNAINWRFWADFWLPYIPILLHFPGSKLSVLHRGPAIWPICLSLYLLVWSPKSSLTLCCFVCLLELLFLPVTLSLLTSSGCGGLAPGFDISARSSIDRFASSMSNLCRVWSLSNLSRSGQLSDKTFVTCLKLVLLSRHDALLFYICMARI